MPDAPHSLIAFQRQFPDEATCADRLAAIRRPEGFRCPTCGHEHAWHLKTKPHTFECRQCHRQTSLTAGTLMHGSKLSLLTRFLAIYLMTTHSNGISAKPSQRQLGLGS